MKSPNHPFANFILHQQIKGKTKDQQEILLALPEQTRTHTRTQKWTHSKDNLRKERNMRASQAKTKSKTKNLVKYLPIDPARAIKIIRL